MKKIALLYAVAFVVLQTTLVAAGLPSTAYQAAVVVADPVVTEEAGKVVVAVEVLASGKRTTLTTQPFDPAWVNIVKAPLAKGNLVDFRLQDKTVLVGSQPSNVFHAVLVKEIKGLHAQFDSMKFGPELTPWANQSGALVAAGWVFAKDKQSITVGDGRLVTHDIAGRPLPKAIKRYEETYKLAKDAMVYEVNTADYSLSRVSSLAALPVTANYETSTIYRQEAFVVFDTNIQGAKEALAKAVYYFVPQSKADGLPVWDVQTMSSLLETKGTDPVTGKPYVAINANKPDSAPYTRSTEPFEIVPKTMWYVGDNEVAVYLFKAKDRLIMLDAGWPYSGYQYWKNIEAVGFDPRLITDIMLTHGHLDHYGTAIELVRMIENSGRQVTLWGTKEDTFGITRDALGNAWNLKGALPDSETEIRSRTVAYEYDKDMDFGNVKILVTPTPGHTPGTGSFVFKTLVPSTGQWISFGYHGGYGFNGLYTPTPATGYLRLNFQLGLAWLQQMVEVDYVAPQHTNQYPLVDVYQALKAYNNDPANKRKLTMLNAMTRNEFINFLEKRYSVVTNLASDINDSRYKSLESSGPFKPGREGGLSGVKATLLDDGKIIQGFSGVFNVNPALPLLKDGIKNVTDTYTKDPDGWYVQFYIDVLDGYQGFLPKAGPVESLRPTAGAPEILRTQRLTSKAEAEAILRSVKKGGTYLINLTAASAIFVPSDVTKTFKENS